MTAFFELVSYGRPAALRQATRRWNAPSLSHYIPLRKSLAGGETLPTGVPKSLWPLVVFCWGGFEVEGDKLRILTSAILPSLLFVYISFTPLKEPLFPLLVLGHVFLFSIACLQVFGNTCADVYIVCIDNCSVMFWLFTVHSVCKN